MIGLASEINNLPQYVRSAVELVGTFQRILNIDSDNNIGPHCFGHICRIVIDNSTVDQYHAVFSHRSEYTGDGHAGTHRSREYAIMEYDLVPIDYIGRYTGEGDR